MSACGGNLESTFEPDKVWLTAPDGSGSLMLKVPKNYVQSADLGETVRQTQADM